MSFGELDIIGTIKAFSMNDLLKVRRVVNAAIRAKRPSRPKQGKSEAEKRQAKLYAEFREVHTECMLCHRTENDRPYWWHGAFLIERMHIVNKPRVEDVRVIIAACSFCHAVQHGARFPQMPGLEQLPIVEIIRAKLLYDPDNYDPAFLQKHSVRLLEFPK